MSQKHNIASNLKTSVHHVNPCVSFSYGFHFSYPLLAKGGAEAEEAIAALMNSMQEIAGHRANTSRAMTPELGL